MIKREDKQELYNTYVESIKSKYNNYLLIPQIEKITISSSIDARKSNSKEMLPLIYEAIYRITGQKPTTSFSSKSRAEFKIRLGGLVGFKVTLRKQNMYNFLTKLITVYLPNIREFRGFNKKSFNQDGLSIGISSFNCLVDLDNKLRGLDLAGLSITISLRRKDRHTFISNEEKESLLMALGFPINF